MFKRIAINTISSEITKQDIKSLKGHSPWLLKSSPFGESILTLVIENVQIPEDSLDEDTLEYEYNDSESESSDSSISEQPTHKLSLSLTQTKNRINLLNDTISYADITQEENSIHIAYIDTHTSWENKGFASFLLKNIFSHFEKNGKTNFELQDSSGSKNDKKNSLFGMFIYAKPALEFGYYVEVDIDSFESLPTYRLSKSAPKPTALDIESGTISSLHTLIKNSLKEPGSLLIQIKPKSSDKKRVYDELTTDDIVYEYSIRKTL